MSDYKKLIEESAEAAEHAPDQFKKAAFKTVLSHLLKGEVTPAGGAGAGGHRAAETAFDRFLSELGVTQEQWERVFDEDENGIHIDLHKIPGKLLPQQQRNLALLLTLAASKQAGKLTSIDIAKLRATCADYDCPVENLARNVLKISGYFRKVDDKCKLTDAGEKAAIALVKQLGGETSNG